MTDMLPSTSHAVDAQLETMALSSHVGASHATTLRTAVITAALLHLQPLVVIPPITAYVQPLGTSAAESTSASAVAGTGHKSHQGSSLKLTHKDGLFKKGGNSGNLEQRHDKGRTAEGALFPTRPRPPTRHDSSLLSLNSLHGVMMSHPQDADSADLTSCTGSG